MTIVLIGGPADGRRMEIPNGTVPPYVEVLVRYKELDPPHHSEKGFEFLEHSKSVRYLVVHSTKGVYVFEGMRPNEVFPTLLKHYHPGQVLEAQMCSDNAIRPIMPSGHWSITNAMRAGLTKAKIIIPTDVDEL